MSGDHIWDGIIAGIVDGAQGTADALFPATLGTSEVEDRMIVRAKGTIIFGIGMTLVLYSYLGPSSLELFLLIWFIVTLEEAMLLIRFILFGLKIVKMIAKWI
jgi:hypothetical protein